LTKAREGPFGQGRGAERRDRKKRQMAHEVKEIGAAPQAVLARKCPKKAAKRGASKMGGTPIKGKEQPAEQNAKKRDGAAKPHGDLGERFGEHELFEHQKQKIVKQQLVFQNPNWQQTDYIQ